MIVTTFKEFLKYNWKSTGKDKYEKKTNRSSIFKKSVYDYFKRIGKLYKF